VARTGEQALFTPDGRYLVVRGRLWRCSNPALDEDRRSALVSALMAARRAVQSARRRGDLSGEAAAHADVDTVKRALGERGEVWWTDAAPDLTRRLVRGTVYAAWFEALAADPSAATLIPRAAAPGCAAAGRRNRAACQGERRSGAGQDRDQDGRFQRQEGPL
jgi:hypothetical protein